MPAAVTAAIAELTRLIGRGAVSRVRQAGDIAQLLGYSTGRYWRAIIALVDDDFLARLPHPANIALNFLSWSLHRDVSVAVAAAGLHPGFGVLHTPGDRQDARVYDLMEEFRAHMVEGLLVYFRRILRRDMFHRADGDGDGAGRRRLDPRLLRRRSPGRRAGRRNSRRVMLHQTHALAQLCTNTDDPPGKRRAPALYPVRDRLLCDVRRAAGPGE